MSTIIQTIQAAFQENLEAVFLLIFATSILYIINIVLGTIIGSFEASFNAKKFWFGVAKGFITALCIVIFSYALNLMQLILQLLDINVVTTDIITVIEVIGVLIAWAWDLILDIFDKIKSLKELKYISYDDVFGQENKQAQEELG